MERTDKCMIIHLPKDLIIKLALELDLSDILNFSMINNKFNYLICDNYTFWMNKHLKDFNWNYTGEKTLAAIKESYKILSHWWNPKNNRELIDKTILETPGLTNLTSLDAYGNPKITDRSVSKLTSLRSLNARWNPYITDASVAKLTYLTFLNANWNLKITDTSVGKLTSLTFLDAGYNPKITDRSVSKLTSLTSLNTIFNPKITDASVAKLTSLTSLNAYDNPKITDRSISQLPKLVEVYR